MSSFNGVDVNCSYVIDSSIHEKVSKTSEINKTITTLTKERDEQDKTAFFIVSNQLEQLKKLVEKK